MAPYSYSGYTDAFKNRRRAALNSRFSILYNLYFENTSRFRIFGWKHAFVCVPEQTCASKPEKQKILFQS